MFTEILVKLTCCFKVEIKFSTEIPSNRSTVPVSIMFIN